MLQSMESQRVGHDLAIEQQSFKVIRFLNSKIVFWFFNT